LINNGHRFSDIKYQYSIPQIYLFFNEITKQKLSEKQFLANILRLTGYTSHDLTKEGLKKMESTWKKVFDSLEIKTEDISKEVLKLGSKIKLKVKR